MNLRIATRKSDLALWQAHWVKARLEALGHNVSLVLIETQGDKDQRPLADLKGQGLFTKAVQEAVLTKQADIAVHSHKDLPTTPVPGLEVAAVSERDDPRDVLVIQPQFYDPTAQNLPLREGIAVGTGAIRRQKQLLNLRPDLVLKDIRGNVPTRVQKLRNGQYDAIMLAAAGLERLQLDLSDLRVVPLDPIEFVPAPAQGVLAIECRREDFEIASILTDLNDMTSYRAIAAERGLMAMLQGGCQLALGAYATFENGLVTLHVWYEGQVIKVEHRTSEGAAVLAYEALGRPT